MIRNIAVLAYNDLAVAFKNKTIFLILFIPFFVFFSLKLTDQSLSDISRVRIGLVRNSVYEPKILSSVISAEKLIEVTWITNVEEGRVLLKKKKIDGVLTENENEPHSLTLLVMKKESMHTLKIVESFAALQKSAQGSSYSWITDIKTLQEGGIQRQTLPTWILMLVLLVGFIVLPAQVAEEKEKKLLLVLLQTPIREVEWLLAKLMVGMVLMITAIVFLHLLGKFGVKNFSGYISVIITGCFCFSAYGILIGFLCRTQASARTLGVIFYLPHLLPSALSDFSEKLSAVAPFFPSYQLYEPLNLILLEDGRMADMPFALIYLFLAGVFMLCLSWLLLKRRWLM